ncbi:DUF1624 domain-containing protein [Occallatibacter riparius]|uniref:Heparan-alpha-glucosaminide N-acetyltransferase domain-containing protein n=1 Tax=Occallatibacter riparius TaxID=1002689 RepID=A0A9J7BWW9_9BACT|nr:heparan-alpha-glucosaminide N-acetyltransferase domain-containing protein [Occallatibacter riparius]UWZ85541.1 heparan-alpha-glucosaminide N-acetyltransferase domain-containing protein [Occallatibacter riparius]
MESIASKKTQNVRLTSIDMLRGLVMVVMALDHTRDFFHREAALFSPTDLTRTSPGLFLTRWVTHFCLPVFMFCAGIGVFLWKQRGHTSGELSRYLCTRGVWFVLLELTVMQFAYDFNFSIPPLILLLILWIFGICMLAMAALVHLPLRPLLILSLAIICLHNLLDSVNPSRFASAVWIWNLLHRPGVIPFAGHQALITYTVLPWIGVMAAGFCFGQLYTLEPAMRQKIMTRIGLGASVAFLVLRMFNHYGDPAPWSAQKTIGLTILSFLNCTKYPASLDFVLMTLGPAIMLLACLERFTPSAVSPLVIFGRVPLFYFVLHFYLIHGLLALMSFVRYGSAASRFVFNRPPSMGGPAVFPTGFGYSLLVVYSVWLGLLLVLYPLCRWFAGVRSRRQVWWMSYL